MIGVVQRKALSAYGFDLPRGNRRLHRAHGQRETGRVCADEVVWMRRARVTMLGAFPPPVGGASLVNAAVLAELVEAGADVTSIDVSGPALAHTRSFAYHARRSVRNLRALLRARRLASPDAAFYIVPDAGLGAWYTRAHVAAVARLYGSVTLHHHSCRYIEEHDRAMAAIGSTAGADATQVFLT